MTLPITIVRHRIDGLEIKLHRVVRSQSVRHRIDGLENQARCKMTNPYVRHRIDGLEKYHALS